jgi:hypothetical protein
MYYPKFRKDILKRNKQRFTYLLKAIYEKHFCVRTVNITADYTLLTLYRSYFKGINAKNWIVTKI